VVAGVLDGESRVLVWVPNGGYRQGKRCGRWSTRRRKVLGSSAPRIEILVWWVLNWGGWEGENEKAK
jgi:hypothetical protein